MFSPATLYRVMVKLDNGAKCSGVLMCCVTLVTWLAFVILLLAEYTTEVPYSLSAVEHGQEMKSSFEIVLDSSIFLYCSPLLL